MGLGRSIIKITNDVTNPTVVNNLNNLGSYTPALYIHPPHLAGTPLGVEVAGIRVSCSEGTQYAGIYIGDGAEATASGNASYSTIHDCQIDGSEFEGKVGIIMAGGSYINIINNLITGWASYGIIMDAGYTRTNYANRIKYNEFIRSRGTAIILCNLCNSNLISWNEFVDDYTTQYTCLVDSSTYGGGTDNTFCLNSMGSAQTATSLVNMKSTDHAFDNFLRAAGNADTKVSDTAVS
jgi:hypothetical protein